MIYRKLLMSINWSMPLVNTGFVNYGDANHTSYHLTPPMMPTVDPTDHPFLTLTPHSSLHPCLQCQETSLWAQWIWGGNIVIVREDEGHQKNMAHWINYVKHIWAHRDWSAKSALGILGLYQVLSLYVVAVCMMVLWNS